jgi:hypothetical protein
MILTAATEEERKKIYQDKKNKREEMNRTVRQLRLSEGLLRHFGEVEELRMSC